MGEVKISKNEVKDGFDNTPDEAILDYKFDDNISEFILTSIINKNDVGLGVYWHLMNEEQYSDAVNCELPGMDVPDQ